MKRFLTVLGALALCLALSACGHFVSIMPGSNLSEEPGDALPQALDQFEETGLMEFMGMQEFAARYYSDTPIALSMRTTQGGYASPIFDRTSIVAACDALRSMTVTGRSEAVAEPVQETVYTFTMADGEEYAFTFADGDLSMYAGRYTVSGLEGLSALAFPGYSDSFDVFDLYGREDIRAFADSFSANAPVSVGRRSNGGATLTSQDPAVVSHAFQLLQYATVARVEENPDQNIDMTQITDYVFTMADGSYYTFTFVGPCLSVTVSADYGPVYYWLDGIDELAYMEILPETTIPTFAGGPLYGMREEIAHALSAANGELPDVTVVGVYVDYTINGEHGYLTLDGNTACSFIQRVAYINAAAETTAPTGEMITVFVTLSDQSGPIIVFTGDTVQQMVGYDHACDSAAMNDLRATILSLAQDSNNIGQSAATTSG